MNNPKFLDGQATEAHWRSRPRGIIFAHAQPGSNLFRSIITLTKEVAMHRSTLLIAALIFWPCWV